MQATVKVYEDGCIELVSYTTPILVAEKCGEDRQYRVLVREIGRYSDPNNDERIYSPTTARHISLFLAEYFPEIKYPVFKKAAIDGCAEFITTLADGKDVDYYG